MLTKQKITSSFILASLFIPSFVLCLYFLLFSMTANLLNLEGVNTVYSDRSWKILLWITLLLGLVYFVLKSRDSEKFLLNRTKSRMVSSDVVLILLPLTPVVQYIIVNRGILSRIDILIIILFFVCSSLFIIFLIPKLLESFGSLKTIKAIGVAFTTSIISMPLMSKQFNWYLNGSLKIQLLFLFAIFLFALLILNINEKEKKFAYSLIVVFFVTNSTIQLINKTSDYSESTQGLVDQKMNSLIKNQKPKNLPNIYLLVYDSYVGNETMLAYGIDNSDQEKYLQENGFILYPETYSTGAATLETMRVVFQLSPEYSGESRSGVSGDGLVQKVLQNLGYQTVGLFEGDYWFKGTNSTYDISYPKTQKEQFQYFIAAILIGEFRFDQEFNSQTHLQFIEIKKNIYDRSQVEQRFIYAHTELPNHSQNSGACLINETELYVERLSRANIEMKEDVENIIESDPQSIIIVAGDHGPYLTKNCYYMVEDYTASEVDRLDIQDRFGTFLSIRWPTDSYKLYDQITVIQDLFPVIFSYLYDDPALLQMRIEPVTQFQFSTSGVYVEDGIIRGGIDDGEPLFLGE